MSVIMQFPRDHWMAQRVSEMAATKSLMPIPDDDPEAWFHQQMQLAGRYRRYVKERMAGKACKSFSQEFDRPSWCK